MPKAKRQVKEQENTNKHVTLRVMRMGEEDTYFHLKRTSPLCKLMNVYCEREGKRLRSTRFLYDGNRLQESNTPEQFEMQDYDIIDVMDEQIGGVFKK